MTKSQGRDERGHQESGLCALSCPCELLGLWTLDPHSRQDD